MNTLHALLLLLAATGSGMIAGLLFVFSNFAMAALAEMDEAEGARAMQLINRKILNPVFAALFFGTALASAGILALFVFGPDGNLPALLGAVLYLVGAFGITVFRNVPLNNRLEAVDTASPECRAFWRMYRRRWTRWNHLRTVLTVAATLALVAGAAAG